MTFLGFQDLPLPLGTLKLYKSFFISSKMHERLEKSFNILANSIQSILIKFIRLQMITKAIILL